MAGARSAHLGVVDVGVVDLVHVQGRGQGGEHTTGERHGGVRGGVQVKQAIHVFDSRHPGFSLRVPAGGGGRETQRGSKRERERAVRARGGWVGGAWRLEEFWCSCAGPQWRVACALWRPRKHFHTGGQCDRPMQLSRPHPSPATPHLLSLGKPKVERVAPHATMWPSAQTNSCLCHLVTRV